MKKLLIFFFGLLAACTPNNTNNSTGEQRAGNDVQLREELITSNKQRMLAEMDDIESWVERKQYQMNETETGLRWMILSEGKGEKPGLLSEVELSYRIYGLDGSYIYSSDSSGANMQLVIGQSDEPTGLQEGLMLISQGTKARFVIPYFLAYGLTGDGDKIKNAMSLVYEVELLKVKNQ